MSKGEMEFLWGKKWKKKLEAIWGDLAEKQLRYDHREFDKDPIWGLIHADYLRDPNYDHESGPEFWTAPIKKLWLLGGAGWSLDPEAFFAWDWRHCICGKEFNPDYTSPAQELCSSCRKIYGNKKDWPRWVRFLVKSEQDESDFRRNHPMASYQEELPPEMDYTDSGDRGDGLPTEKLPTQAFHIDPFTGLGQTSGNTMARRDNHELWIDVKPIFWNLPAREKKIVAMRYYGHCTLDEIAEEMGVSHQAISKTLKKLVAK